MWYALGFLLLLAVGNMFVYSMQVGDAIPYSELRRASATARCRKSPSARSGFRAG